MTTQSLDKRLWNRVDFHSSPDGCWLWQGSTSRGYGRLVTESENYVHRIAYEAVVGKIPEETTLDHLCRVRNCVNPDHLEPVSLAENILRGNGVAARNARKTHCKRGHMFTPENTYLIPSGGRACRECQRDNDLRRYYRDRSPKRFMEMR